VNSSLPAESSLDDDSVVPSGSIAAIIPAAGSGRRFGQQSNKLFAEIAGQPLWVHSAQRLRNQTLVGRIVMPIAEVDRGYFSVQHADTLAQLRIEIVTGGAERSDSVRAGIARLDDDENVRCGAVASGVFAPQWAASHRRCGVGGTNWDAGFAGARIG
jgi:hypothetical protein